MNVATQFDWQGRPLTMTRVWSCWRIAGLITVIAALLAGHSASARTEGGANGSPTIVLPDSLVGGGQSVDAPIDVRFVTAADTQVDLGSLHVWVHKFIGWIDVTQRLLQHPQVRVGVWGIHLDGGVLPAGEHLVRLSLQDMKGRATEAIRTIRIGDFTRRM